MGGKRGRKPKDNNSNKNYFQEIEEQAIIDYIKSDSSLEKNKIFNNILQPALTKMIESIMRRYKLYVPDEEFTDTFNDTMSYLLSKIENFNPDKGHKAYSYCGTVAKNYLISKNVQLVKNKKRTDAYDVLKDGFINNIKYSTVSSYNDLPERLIANSRTKIKEMINNPEEYKLSEKELVVGNALYNLFENWSTVIDEGSNKLYKSSVLYYLRESTMMSTKEVRDNMKKYKSIYKAIKEKNI